MTAPARIDRPRIGFYKRRLVKGGVFVPVVIYRPCPIEMQGHWSDREPPTFQHIDRWPHLAALENGEPVDVTRVWPSCSGRPISLDEYEFMLADRDWCAAYAPDDPKARPYRPVDPLTLTPVF